MTNSILAFAAAHGFEAIARDDGAAVSIFIPYLTPVLYADGSVAFYDEGVEMVEVSTLAEARSALGY